MTCDLLPPVLRYLQEIDAQTVLVLGQQAGSVASACRAAHAGCAVTASLCTEMDSAARYPAAVLIGCIEYLEKAAALALIARLRDLQAARLLVVAPIGPEWTGHASYWQETEFLGMGMQIYGRLACDAGTMLLCRYDIRDYKQVPDWFNSKYWAHPEHWKP